MRAAVFLGGFGLFFQELWRGELRVVQNRTTNLPWGYGPVGGLGMHNGTAGRPRGRRLLCVRANRPAANEYESQCCCQRTFVH